MRTLTFENAARLLSDLVAIPSVNPLGRPYERQTPVERGVVRQHRIRPRD